MTPRLISALLMTLVAMPTIGAEMPARKAGLWELQTGANGPGLRQCIDAATDQMMQARAGTAVGPGGVSPQCSKHDVQKSGDTVTIDATCTRAGKTVTSHAVVTGSFDSAYSMTVTARSDALPGGTVNMTLDGKWLGACPAGQKPGDVIMPGGIKVNIRDLKKLGLRLPGAPLPN